ncbi:MAG: HAD-IC family P-type ATPase [Patescibacteria group bacterium]|jgi:Ca2+-transporting ATPase
MKADNKKTKIILRSPAKAKNRLNEPLIESNWHSLEAKACLKSLNSASGGLSADEAQRRLEQFGKNELNRAKPASSVMIFLSQFKSPLVYVLLIAAIISILLQKWPDAAVIAVVVGINAWFGWFQENKANRALEKLRAMVVYYATVFRDGRPSVLPAAKLVPGDVIALKSGDKVPADCRLFEIYDLQTSEAALTGESNPVSKETRKLNQQTVLADRKNMVYLGTTVVRGKGLAVVCATGSKTEFGQIGKMLEGIKEEKTLLFKQLEQFSRLLALAVLIICLIILVMGLFRGYGVGQMLIIAAAVAVAAIPEGLLISLTIVSALGMQRILQHHALVRHLSATETLGRISVILTDKTGTLTEGHMRVARLLTAEREFSLAPLQEPLEGGAETKELALLAKISLLCSSARIVNPEAALAELQIIADPTEQALVLSGLAAGFNKEELDLEYPKVAEIPFDSSRKYMATLHRHKADGHSHIFAKGAPEKILPFCNRVLIGGEKRQMSPEQVKLLKIKVEELAKEGLRVLALAYDTADHFKRLDEKLPDLVFVGFVALKDPLRLNAAKAVVDCRNAGIRTVIVTGDHKITAQAIYAELGLGRGRILTGEALDKLDEVQLMRQLPQIDVYARVEPRHKLRLVHVWRNLGQVVAMTGDGINDAPALKAADVGIALGGGTDVAKEAADMVLLNNGFDVIVEAIKEGRNIFDNIKKVTLYLFLGSFSEIILLAGALFLGLPLPLIAIQILWINLIDHGLPNLTLAAEAGNGEAMAYPPAPREQPILDNKMKWMIIVAALMTDVLLLLIYIVLETQGAPLAHIRTIILATLSADALLYAFSLRSLYQPVWRQSIFGNRPLFWSVTVSFILLFAVIYAPFFAEIFGLTSLDLNDWLIVMSLAVFKTIMIEIMKDLLFRRKPNGNIIKFAA